MKTKKKKKLKNENEKKQLKNDNGKKRPPRVEGFPYREKFCFRFNSNIDFLKVTKSVRHVNLLHEYASHRA